jgi:hypothetical protein
MWGFPYRKKIGMAHLSQRNGSRGESFRRRAANRETMHRIMSAMIETLYSPTATAAQANIDIALE